MRRYSFYIDGSHFDDLLCDVENDAEYSDEQYIDALLAIKEYVRCDSGGVLVHEDELTEDNGLGVYLYYSPVTRRCTALTVAYVDDADKQ